jgi:trehalose 6-phosphate synthase
VIGSSCSSASKPDARPADGGTLMSDPPLVLVSNRGPVTFQEGGEIRRGTGGLVTALIGLASHREVTWVASAMTDEDIAAAERHDGHPFPVQTPDGREYRVKLVASDEDAYDRFYNIIANPMLWFIQHYLWDLSNAPDIRRNETEAFEFGYNAVNEDLARAVLDEIEGVEQPVVMVHDYHLYTVPAMIRNSRPDVFLHHFVHIPWSQSDSWRVLPSPMRREIFEGILSNDIIGFHTRSYRRNFLQCCEDLFDLEVDHQRGIVRFNDREVWVRAYPLPIDAGAVQAVSRSARTREFETELLRRRRDHLILRVDRADLSKNVLRGFSAFDLFLEQHPEFRERVTFIAQLMPSRTDVPEYAEYLERIEAVVAVVNHRHGSPDWMPIQLKLRDDLEEAVATYKHYDVLMVNAMFDGMNLVAKEGPMVNERAGVSILSENTGAHEELGEFALSVNPFDIQELADSIHAALTMAPEERERRHAGLRSIVTARNPGDWIDEQLADIREKARG